MELPKRKQIRLQGYDYSSNGAYFVTICVKDRAELLGKIIVGDDAHIVPHIELSQYGMVAQKYINKMIDINKMIYINKCVIMPNHIHMIIVVDDIVIFRVFCTKKEKFCKKHYYYAQRSCYT